ncbi:alpha/beta hydrolase [Lactobacillus sp. CBA3605]|uniref:alpha/beta fold hydrolase n=1 Tax=Lactobacillus sp. CBA3605 TaxID=2099788 RepID=UPI000CFC3933|nr:alpha/beta hydrolase [Lactobacillus sp. CBA3605]AVK61598.1 alpha/beta hydrolase [Lactobacillus sp. CBA3605]
MKFMTSDHVSLDYTDTGHGRAVVILTGFGGSKAIWAAQIPVLVAAGYRVINLDGRCQGLSQHTAKGLRMSRRALDAAELIAALQLDRPILLGNSMGAATWFAYLSLFGDANVGAVIDVDQSPKMINTPQWAYGFKKLTWADFPASFQQPLGRSTFKHIDDDTYAQVKAVAAQAPFDAALMGPLLINHAVQDWRDVVRQLTKPFLIIAGRESPYFNSEFAAVVAQTAPQGHSVVIPEAGHIVMAEQSAAFNATLLPFLATIA